MGTARSDHPDEATALAAGHLSCFECRRKAASRFLDAWRQRGGRDGATLADVDHELSEQRRLPRSGLGEGKRAYRAKVDRLPNGAMVELDGRAWLLHEGALIEWSFDGYDGAERRAVDVDDIAWVLTLYGTVRTLGEGLRPGAAPEPHWLRRRAGAAGRCGGHRLTVRAAGPLHGVADGHQSAACLIGGLKRHGQRVCATAMVSSGANGVTQRTVTTET